MPGKGGLEYLNVGKRKGVRVPERKGKGVGIPEGRRGGGGRIGVPTPVTAATVATRDTTG